MGVMLRAFYWDCPKTESRGSTNGGRLSNQSWVRSHRTIRLYSEKVLDFLNG
jgi:hypothetical protein